jgi:hypothetical protein
METDIKQTDFKVSETQELIKQDLKAQTDLKLEIAGFFGRIPNFFQAFCL